MKYFGEKRTHVNDKFDFMKFIFLESSQEEQSTRTRRTLWDVLADLGGFLEIVVLGVPLCILSYRRFKMKADIVRELY